MDPIEIMAQAMFPSTFDGSVEVARETVTTLVKALDAADFVIVPKAEIARLRAYTIELRQMLTEFTSDA